MELYSAAYLIKSALLEFEDHEGFRWSVIFTGQAVFIGWLKTKARIVKRVSKHDHESIATISAVFQTPTDELRADTLVLVPWEDRQRGKGGDPDVGGCLGDAYRGEEDMADYLPIQLGDQGHDHRRLVV